MESDKWVTYIQENSFSQLNLSDLAGKFNCSTETLRHRISRETGTSFKHLYLESKITTATRLMDENPGWSLTRIAGKVSVTDPCYFSRLFRKYMGRTPSDYRKGII